ncbi:hypothetical protein SAMN05444360_102208 [Chryseobacterium carnipullorum]|uniref:hypothetical protein n=1 Tax=Chryseobacterium TaxID=59732 RepID=UPI00067AC523|nr:MULTISPECIES: hypothetical protein [Chryseobacterium]SHL53231.1 hypothetical protein SAMN05444360_102208 [Chryseobacterium carnipullorum]
MDTQIKLYINDINYLEDQINTNGLVKFDADDFVMDSFEINCNFQQTPLPENFPLCCESHKRVQDNIQVWFDKFPNCCERHSKLNTKEWFNKKNYEHVPLKVNKQAYYTNEFVVENLYSDDWYSIITDYFEYNFDSFGHPNIGGYEYQSVVTSYLQAHLKGEAIDNDEIGKVNRLINYFENQKKPIVPIKDRDIFILQIAFQKWIETLPDIKIFSDFKSKFSKSLPLNLYVTGEVKVNRYTKRAKLTVKLLEDLVVDLLNITKQIIKSISLENDNKHFQDNLVKIISEEHLLKQRKLFENYSKNEKKYIKILEKWLFNEKEYSKELINIYSSENFIKQNETENKKNLISKIVEKIYSFGVNLEKYESINEYLDEEKLRDLLLPGLNSSFDNLSSTGETFNKKGKTDILIQDISGDILFIAECKIWKGQSKILDSLNQLFDRYLNWRTDNCALIFFNKNTKNVTDILVKINANITIHPLYKNKTDDYKETVQTYLFKHPVDNNREIRLNVFLFNCF